MLQTHGVRGWAAKLLTDRSVIVPRVAPNRAIEQGLLQAIKRLEEAWFVRLDGFDCEVAEHLELRAKGRDDGDDGGWRHAAVGAFELTQMGRRWQARLGDLREVGGLEQQQRSSGGASLWEDEVALQNVWPDGLFLVGITAAAPVFEEHGDEDGEGCTV